MFEGKFDDVKFRRNILPSKMDGYGSPKAKNKVPCATDCRLKNQKSEENAQKVCNDSRQNNNAQLNQMSCIPNFNKNSDKCHNFTKNMKFENRCSPVQTSDQKNIHANSAPIADENQRIPSRILKTHMRRHSVGFESVTSVPFFYGHNFTNDKRMQSAAVNSIYPSASVLAPSNMLNSDNGGDINFEKGNHSESGCMSEFNQNTQLKAENGNDLLYQKKDRQFQRYKDKSSKRKSSLNRMDFVHFPDSHTRNFYSQKECFPQKNSSSDEGSDAKSQQEFLCSTSKRKHITASKGHLSKVGERKLNEVTLQNSSVLNRVRANILPRTLQNCHTKLQRRWNLSGVSHFPKLSHSAGELESLKDGIEAAVNNKTCLSAQEYDGHEPTNVVNMIQTKTNAKCLSLAESGSHSILMTRDSSEDASHNKVKKEQKLDTKGCNGKPLESTDTSVADIEMSLSFECGSIFSSELLTQEKETASAVNTFGERDYVVEDLKLSRNFNLKHVNSEKYKNEDPEIANNTVKMENLEISNGKYPESDCYISAEENSELVGSDNEKRPNSILRKKLHEEKKELHSILKPPPDDKLSKAPHSILKHRESSEEKDVWQNDLHSILKKSTSEEESCNSGPDIRPILKVSTDDESPGGSVKPRPILKKRTSFSEECAYASFPSGELRPILKKKTPLASEEQPRPILKSRRKSEDTRSTMSEFIASRPRAYSADMGIKCNQETELDSLELKKKDFTKQNL